MAVWIRTCSLSPDVESAWLFISSGGLFVVEQVAPRVDPTVLYLIAVPISDIEYRAGFGSQSE